MISVLEIKEMSTSRSQAARKVYVEVWIYSCFQKLKAISIPNYIDLILFKSLDFNNQKVHKKYYDQYLLRLTLI